MPEPRGNLCISRKLGESFEIGDDITVTVISAWNGKVKLSIRAPFAVRVFRTELLPLREQTAAEGLRRIEELEGQSLSDDLQPLDIRCDHKGHGEYWCDSCKPCWRCTKCRLGVEFGEAAFKMVGDGVFCPRCGGELEAQ